MNWTGRRVLITGHTGFKGSWLSLWLGRLGAELCGYALEPPTCPSLFDDAQVATGMRSEMGDVRDLERLRAVFSEFHPELVFHLAAQPLVRASYADPVGTYATNLMGTVHVLEAIRHCPSVRAAVLITTDKCYENREWMWGYREIDRLGGFDPYSNSKACAELAVAAYRNSFFSSANYYRHGVALATARAGNVIGGGDWAKDRLVPDIMRAFSLDQAVQIRNPRSTRPWQHVLEPLRGYLSVAERLLEAGPSEGEPWNFGPDASDVKPVEWIVATLAKQWGDKARWQAGSEPQPHEAQNLSLDWAKAAARLQWRPALRLEEALAMTAQWYRARLEGKPMRNFTEDQISQYEQRLSQSPGQHCHPQGADQ